MTDIQRQFQGFLNTPFAWQNRSSINLQEFDYQTINTPSTKPKIEGFWWLGKLVEQFVFEELKQSSAIEILATNIQIQDDKVTLGELDALLLQNGIPVHLEIVYKFYLYQKSVLGSEIARWVGPNQRDSLIQKLTKLKEKQLPLLHHEKTTPYLDTFHLSSKAIRQNVYFKAQLFVPESAFGNSFPIVNNECIYGFYIPYSRLSNYQDSKFYIPTKHYWLVDVHTQVDWQSFSDFSNDVQGYLANKNSPLCWMKKPNGVCCKFFVVWWEC